MLLFDIDFDRLSRWLLPLPMRRARTLAFLRALLLPLIEVYTLFRTHRAEVIVELDRTGQVCRLKNALNDTYDANLRRFKIVDGPNLLPLFLHLIPENRPVYISSAAPKYLYTIPETVGGDDFIVQAPAGTVAHPEAVRALVDKYRLASKKDFSIVPL